MYILRTCTHKDGKLRSYGGFVWPEEGLVEAPDWTPGLAKCGNGLHGLPWGQGDNSLLEREDPVWLVARVDDADVVKFNGKCTFPRAWVLFVGNEIDARTKLAELFFDQEFPALIAKAPNGEKVQNVQGDSGSANVQGDSGSANVKGDSGSANVKGDYGSANVQGYSGSANVKGKYSIAFVNGNAGKVKGDAGSTLILTWFETEKNLTRVVVRYVGEHGIKPDTWYRLSDDHEFVECES